MVIIETPIFSKQLLATLSDDEYRELQRGLLGHPEAGKVIPGSGGLRSCAGLSMVEANVAECG